jgi:hypothetical protein
MGHEVYGSIVRLGTSFAHTSEKTDPTEFGPTRASKGWGAPRAYSDLNIGDKVRRTDPLDIDAYGGLGCLDILHELYGMHVGSFHSWP